MTAIAEHSYSDSVTDRQTDRQTDWHHYHANSWSRL